MKKSSSIVLSMLLCFGVSTATASAHGTSSSAHNPVPVLKKQSGSHFILDWNKKKEQIPSFIGGKLSKNHVENASAVLAYVKAHQDLYKLNPSSQLKLVNVKKDKLGMTHYTFEQVVKGVPVDQTRFTVHVSKKGIVKAVNTNAKPEISDHLVTPMKAKISKATALKKAWAKIHLTKKATEKASKHPGTTPKSLVASGKKLSHKATPSTTESAKLVVYSYKGKSYLAYHTTLRFINPKPGNWQIYVNAVNGHVINAFNAVDYDGPTTGSGVGVLGDTKPLNLYLSGGYYYLYDTTKPMNGVIETHTAQNGTSLPGPYLVDYTNNFTYNDERAAVDANYYAGKVYDFYHNTFGRNSWDNQGSSIVSTVHYSTNYNNAFWNGNQMVYGDGDGYTFIALSGGEDVVAHELTHAVTQTTAGLDYQGQSGALNESMSDVFAVLMTQNNYLIGEDVYTPGTPGDALRSLSNPTQYGQPDNMSGYVDTSSDNGGVHTNSGIPNKAGYLTMNALGFSKTSQIYYRALTVYLTPSSDFSAARAALLQSAADLYGSGSSAYNAVQNAWNQVGVY